MIEIYKKLPKTNCGKCGMSTCMAFAQKVKKGELLLTDCPLMAGDVLSESPYKRTDEAFSTYEEVSDDLEKEAVSVDFSDAAAAIGGRYEQKEGRESISLKLIDSLYEMRKEGLYKDNEYCSDPWTKIIVYDYVRRKGSRSLSGDWITLGHFPHTASHVKAFQSSAEKKVADAFSSDLQKLKEGSAELGGVEGKGKSNPDFFCTFNLLPKVPLYLSFYVQDEEFDAECKILFDRSAEDYIDIEYLAYLLEVFVEKLARNQQH